MQTNATVFSVGTATRRLLRYVFTPVAWLSLFLLLAFISPSAFGQAFGTIGGTVTDQSGAVIPGAKVTITESDTGFSRDAVSDSNGYYVVPNLRPTKYNLSVLASGFKKFAEQNIPLLANQAATVDVRLQVGSVTQTLEVTEAAPLVNTTTQTLGDVIERERMVELPLNGRDAVQSISLVAGASDTSVATTTSQSTPPGSAHVNINGSRNNQTGYSLDGATFIDQYYNVNVPFPFPDALQEFSVQTENYSARYGGNGGGVVNVVTRSGGNTVHGNVFEFVRNPVFNARPYFATSRDQIKRNQFGGTIGGPVWIPHLYNGHDRTFFFFGYQGERYRDASTGHAFVPTDAELNGDFSALLTVNPNNPFNKAEQIIDPKTGKPFPGNQIPTQRFDPASLALTNKYLPRATGAGQVSYTQPTSQNIDQISLRIDHRLGNSDNLMGRYYRDHIILAPQNPPGNLLGYAAGLDQPFQNLMIQETHTFRPTLLNQASFTFSDVPTSKTFSSDSPNVASFGVNLPWLPTDKWLQSVSISGAFSISGGAKGPFNTRNTGFQDNLSWVHGKHTMDIGMSFGHASVDLGDQFQSQGSFTFNATATNNPISSFLLGTLNNFTQGAGEYKNNRNNFWAFYFNDNVHATQQLTLNYGLRYEPYTPWKEIHGRVEQFRIDNFNAGIRSTMFPNAPPGLLFPGDPGMPFDGVTGSYKDVSPRVGFAYDVFGNGKTSVRGGFGLFFDTQTAGVINNRFADISPFSPQVTLTPPPGPFSQPLLGYTGYYPFPFTYPPASSTLFSLPDGVDTFDPSSNYKVPVSYGYDLAVEQQLSTSWMVQAAYVGSLSRHQKETIELDPATYIPGSKLTTDQRRRFAPYYGSIAMDGQDVGGSFNALEVTLKKRMTQHLSLTAAYTWSKTLDDIPQGGSNNDIGSDSASTLPSTDPNRHSFDYGPSDFDHAHRLVTSYVLLLPAFKNTNAVVRQVIGNWELSGIVTLQSGGAFTVTAGKDQSQTGLNKDRGVQAPGVNPFQHGVCTGSVHCVNWLNPAAFNLPAIGTFGTMAKDSLRGPGSVNWDAGLFKNIPIERVELQFRAEFFNAVNHTNLNNPNASISGSGFGTITGSAGPRIGQLAMKLTF